MKSHFIWISLAAVTIEAVSSGAQTQNTLHDFMEQVLRSSKASSRDTFPSALQIAKAFDPIPTMAPGSLSDSVPLIKEALYSPDSDIRRLGITAVDCIDQRSDSETIIAPLTEPLLSLLADSDPDIAALAVRSVTSAKPQPPQSVVAPLIDYLAKTEPANRASVTIVYALIRIAPGRSDAIAAIENRLKSETTSNEIRAGMVHALAYRTGVPGPLLRDISSFLDKSHDPDVRLAAIEALTTIGPGAIQMAHDALVRISDDSAETESIRSAAERAISASNVKKVQ